MKYKINGYYYCINPGVPVSHGKIFELVKTENQVFVVKSMKTGVEFHLLEKAFRKLKRVTPEVIKQLIRTDISEMKYQQEKEKLKKLLNELK